MNQSFGGVLINAERRVLLRQPSGFWNGCVWTFPKGKPEPGELPEQTALREVLEETGVEGKIVRKIPGRYVGSGTSNEYFLMTPVRETGKFDRETQEIRWVTEVEARQLLALTSRPKRRLRDIQLLAAAFAEFDRIGSH